MDPSRPPVAMQEMPQMMGGFPNYYDSYYGPLASTWPWAMTQMYVPSAQAVNGQSRPQWFPEYSTASSAAPVVAQQAPVAAPPRSPIRPKRNKEDAKAHAASASATATAAAATTTTTPTPTAHANAKAAAAAALISAPSASAAQASSPSRAPSVSTVLPTTAEVESVYVRRERVARSRKRSLTREEVLLMQPTAATGRVVAVQREIHPHIAEKKKDTTSFTAILNAASQSVIDQIEKLRDQYIHHQRTLAKLQSLREEIGNVPVPQEESSRDSSPPVPEPVAAAATRRQRRQVQTVTPVPTPTPTPIPTTAPQPSPAPVSASTASRSRPTTAEPEPEPPVTKERRTRNHVAREKEEEREPSNSITAASNQSLFATHARTDGAGRVYVCPQCHRCFSHGPAFSQHIRYHQRDAEQASEANGEESEDEPEERRTNTRRSAQQQPRKRRR